MFCATFEHDWSTPILINRWQSTPHTSHIFQFIYSVQMAAFIPDNRGRWINHLRSKRFDMKITESHITKMFQKSVTQPADQLLVACGLAHAGLKTLRMDPDGDSFELKCGFEPWNLAEAREQAAVEKSPPGRSLYGPTDVCPGDRYRH